MKLAPVIGSAALLLAGCFGGGFLHDQHLDGPWRLVAVDAWEDMTLCRRLEQSACAGDMLHGPTVFAAGIDERYVVYARHPRTFPNGLERHVTEFHYVIRTPDDDRPGGLKAENIKGPFDEAAFEAERRRLGLPAFTGVFEDLR
ncbi:hypothetical protein [Brevundimonas sp.]|uniref:hypothetical protein n=1 Tax=Brevundimonas sp. TaxID=1871086 RepID=UPI002D4362AC|nr:hypothetical protein [Brevundimonas sp.]HYC75677.1 hypothetical protein [Brevundimonas sp.]